MSEFAISLIANGRLKGRVGRVMEGYVREETVNEVMIERDGTFSA